MSPLGHVDDLVRAGGEVQPGEAHRGSHHVADERLELAPIAGMHEDPVVHGEAASPPRIQQLDPLLAQPPPSAEQSEHLVSEELLGRSPRPFRSRAEEAGVASPSCTAAREKSRHLSDENRQLVRKLQLGRGTERIADPSRAGREPRSG